MSSLDGSPGAHMECSQAHLRGTPLSSLNEIEDQNLKKTPSIPTSRFSERFPGARTACRTSCFA
eukprot:CAMPEP_0114157250 /NCGR_PEP_ID=MMETSP0043_2-20121206/26513_1 /TAXON_ID=464988 /ORGANISM="Hemiselmis andersenii, Strain CCMP644" /LENGTH=63 /DNA_ID=CAMNT_0001252789 /DNA_START=279 /DNA_END=467 /DNA_ORIENTATION=-